MRIEITITAHHDDRAFLVKDGDLTECQQFLDLVKASLVPFYIGYSLTKSPKVFLRRADNNLCQHCDKQLADHIPSSAGAPWCPGD